MIAFYYILFLKPPQEIIRNIDNIHFIFSIPVHFSTKQNPQIQDSFSVNTSKNAALLHTAAHLSLIFIMIADFKACGGFVLVATGLRIMKVKDFPVADMTLGMVLVMPVSFLWVTFLLLLIG